MPVQSWTTAPTASRSTEGRINGRSPCAVASSAILPRRLAKASARSSAVISAGTGIVAPPSPAMRASGSVDGSGSGGGVSGAGGTSPTVPVSSTAAPSPRNRARKSRISSTSAFSASQRSRAASRSACARDSAASTSALRSPTSMPMASSRPMIPASISNDCRRRSISSTSAGVACCETATRAQTVSSRLIALSGNCREGI